MMMMMSMHDDDVDVNDDIDYINDDYYVVNDDYKEKNENNQAKNISTTIVHKRAPITTSSYNLKDKKLLENF